MNIRVKIDQQNDVTSVFYLFPMIWKNKFIQ